MDIFKNIFGTTPVAPVAPEVPAAVPVAPTPEPVAQAPVDFSSNAISVFFTVDVLKGMFPSTRNVESLVDPLKKTMDKYSINTKNRVAQFLAQCGHESGGFTIYQENLNYTTPSRLVAVFGKYFPNEASTVGYVGHPEKIGARVYGGRMGNGPESTGEGYTYRGRGFIQLTGKDNYSCLASSLGMSLADVVTYLGTLEGAAMSAGWFWNSRNLNTPADAEDTDRVTYLINGGYNGLAERKALYAKAKSLM